MKKFLLSTIMMLACFGVMAQTSWSSLKGEKLKLTRYCKGELVDNEVERSGSMHEADWLEYFYLYSDGERFIWEKMDGTERYHVNYDRRNSVLEVEHGNGDLEWLQIVERDDNKVTLWCQDGYIRYCRIVKSDESFSNLVGKKLQVDMTCEGEVDHGHVIRSGDITRVSRRYIVVKDLHRINIVKEGEVVARYHGYINSNSFDVDETLDGPSFKFFQIIDRNNDKYTIWGSDSKIRYCKLVDTGDDYDDDDRYYDDDDDDDDHHHHHDYDDDDDDDDDYGW